MICEILLFLPILPVSLAQDRHRTVFECRFVLEMRGDLLLTLRTQIRQRLVQVGLSDELSLAISKGEQLYQGTEADQLYIESLLAQIALIHMEMKLDKLNL